MNIALVLLLAIAGICLLLIEIFLLPGTTLAGIIGILSLVGGVVVAYLKIGAMAGHITLAATIVFLAIGIYLFIRSKALDKMSLKTDINSKIDLLEDTDIKIGDIVTTATRLAPMGKVRVGQKEFEAKSISGFLDAGTDVKIISIEGNILTVSK